MAEEGGSSSWASWGVPLIVVACLVLCVVILLLVRWYIRRPMYHGPARIDGKTVLITGGNTGIGKETAKDLVRRGGKIILLCRDGEKGRVAAEEISGELGGSVSVYKLDLSSFESIRNCASLLKEKEPKIDILINNAGVMLTPKMETKDGFEMQFGTNHLGHFLLTLLLLDNIKAASPASRIINVSSLAHEFGTMKWDDLHGKTHYSPSGAYSQSKLANILFTKSLAEKLKGAESGVTTYALHPGVVQTEIGRHIEASLGSLATYTFRGLGRLFYKDARLGAQTTVYCAVDEAIANHTGKYYSGCKEKRPSRKAQNMEDAERLWKASLEIVGMADVVI